MYHLNHFTQLSCAAVSTIHPQSPSHLAKLKFYLWNTNSSFFPSASVWQPPFCSTNIFAILINVFSIYFLPSLGRQPGFSCKCLLWGSGIKGSKFFLAFVRSSTIYRIMQGVLGPEGSFLPPPLGVLLGSLEVPRETGQISKRRLQAPGSQTCQGFLWTFHTCMV